MPNPDGVAAVKGTRAAIRPDGQRLVWLWRHGRGELPGLLAFAALVAGGAACSLAIPWVQKDLLDGVVAQGVTRRVWWLLVTWAALAVGDQGAGAGRRLLLTRLDVRMAIGGRTDAFRHVLALPHAGVEARGSSQILADMDYAARGTGAIPLILEWTVGLAARIAGAVGALLLLSRIVVLATAPFLVAYAVVPRLLATWIRGAERAEQDTATAVRGTVLDHVEGLRDIRLLGAEGWALGRLREAWGRLGGAAWRTSLAHQGSDTVNWSLRTCAYLAAWAAGLRAMEAGHLGAGGLLAVTLYLGSLFDPLDRVLSLQYHWIGWMLDIDRSIALERQAAAGRPGPSARAGGTADTSRAPGDASIRVEDLAARHPDQARPAIRVPGVLHVPAGSALALTGPNGAGKSTLLQCILGLLPPERGRVSFGGAEADSMDEGAFRRHVAALLPEPAIFGGTVADNLRAAAAQATDEDLMAALCAVGLREWLHALPNGLSTPVGRRGTPLSAGQRQRFGLARLLLRDAPVWVLDEPTSAIDGPSVQALWAAIRRGAAGQPRTMIVATHSPEVAGAADRRATVRDGVVTE